MDTSISEHPILIAPEYPEGFLLNYPEWPGTPYFAIDRTVRERRIRALISNETTDEVLAKKLEAQIGIDNPKIWQEIKLTVPIYHTHEEVIEAFGAYLRFHFPLQGKAGKKRDRTIKIGSARRCLRSSNAAQRSQGAWCLPNKLAVAA